MRVFGSRRTGGERLSRQTWTVIRWGAPAALVGGVLFVLSAALTNFFPIAGPVRYLADVPAYAALLLGVSGL